MFSLIFISFKCNNYFSLFFSLFFSSIYNGKLLASATGLMLLHYHSEAQNRHRLSTFHYVSDDPTTWHHNMKPYCAPRRSADQAADLAQRATICNNHLICNHQWNNQNEKLFKIFWYTPTTFQHFFHWMKSKKASRISHESE